MAATQDDAEESAEEGAAGDCVSLPQYIVCSPPNFKWGETEAESIVRTINRAYEEIVGWKRNLFRVPSGAIGKSFVCEFTSLFVSYNEAAGMEQIVLRAAMVMPALLLQRCGLRMKTSEMKRSLERRIDM